MTIAALTDLLLGLAVIILGTAHLILARVVRREIEDRNARLVSRGDGPVSSPVHHNEKSWPPMPKQPPPPPPNTWIRKP